MLSSATLGLAGMELILFTEKRMVPVVPCLKLWPSQCSQHNNVKLFLSRSYTASRVSPFLSLTCSPPSKYTVGGQQAGREQNWDSWQELTSGILHTIHVPRSAVKLGDSVPGLPWLRDWQCTGWLVVTASASLSPTLFYTLTCFYLNSQVFSLLPNCFPYPTGAEWASGCVVLSCLLGFIHICLGTCTLKFSFAKIMLYSTGLHKLLAFLQFKAAFCILIPYIKSFHFWSLLTSRSTLVSSRI